MKIFFNQHLFKLLGLNAALVLMLLFNQVVFAAAGKFLFVNGDVSIFAANGQLHKAKKGDELNEGDAVVTKSSGYAQIKMQDGGAVSVRPDTNFKVNKFQFDGKQDGSEKSFFSLSKGSVRAVTGLIGKKHRENYKIETATATIGVRGSGADVGHSDVIGTAVHTLFGGHIISTAVDGKLFTLETSPGQTALVAPGAAPQYVPSFPFSTASAPSTKSEEQKEDKAKEQKEDKPADQSSTIENSGSAVNSTNTTQSSTAEISGGSVNSQGQTQSDVAIEPLPTSPLGTSSSALSTMSSNVDSSNALIATPSTVLATNIPIVTRIETTAGVALTSDISASTQLAANQAALTQLASANVRTSSSFEMPVNSNMSAFQVGSLIVGNPSVSIIYPYQNLSLNTLISSPISSFNAITVGYSGVLSNSSALVGQSVPEVTFFSPLRDISWLLTGGYPALFDNFTYSTHVDYGDPGVYVLSYDSGDYGINDLATQVRVGAYSRLSLFQHIDLNGWNLVIDNPTDSPIFYDLYNSDFWDASSFNLTPTGRSSFFVGLVNNDDLGITASSAVLTTNLSEVGSDLGVNWGRYTVQSASSTSSLIPTPNTYHVIEAINLMTATSLASLAFQPSAGIIGYHNSIRTTSPTNELGQHGTITGANAFVNFSSGEMTLSISGTSPLSSSGGLGAFSATSSNGTISQFVGSGINMNGSCSGGGCGSGSMLVTGNAVGGFISELPSSSEIPIPGAVISSFSLKNANGNAAIGTIYIKR